ncbi:hypothetical protein FEM48_Zijuj01G0102000 [Ziziphus jujuba var. spinosa]|uniref:EGF-like domain-containing protein n=1 Tax=Ziziphus jujuba var. spinosa TaxID=714518 RepID=A0A978W0N1_ZIZJJ|nr:hypothetical protein FEM48_Zijuj01G0102000 [Ziziphus jujuba var. spinosa]
MVRRNQETYTTTSSTRTDRIPIPKSSPLLHKGYGSHTLQKTIPESFPNPSLDIAAVMKSKQFLTHFISLVGIYISILIAAALAAAAATTTTIVESSHKSISLPNCSDHCGGVKVPYPFGITPECSLNGNRKFYLNCTQSSLYLNSSNLQVTNISLDGEVSVMNFIGRDCYNKKGVREEHIQSQLWLANYNVSSARNTFIAVGCDTYSTVNGYRGKENYVIGCVSSCNDIDYESFTSDHQSCLGVGCCQISIPSGLKNMTISLSSYNNHTFVHDFNPCSYAFVVEQGKFKFSNTSFQELNRTEKLPAVLNWGIGKESCDEAKKRANYTCKGNNVTCVAASNAAGYLCQCLPGYEGNPYLPDGCHDIDECKDPNRCAKNSQCHNLPGNWTCICPKGYHYGNETGCSNSNQSQRLVLLLCIAMAMELEGQRAMEMHQWGTRDVGSEETEYLLTEDPPSDLYSIDISGQMCSQQMTS